MAVSQNVLLCTANLASMQLTLASPYMNRPVWPYPWGPTLRSLTFNIANSFDNYQMPPLRFVFLNECLSYMFCSFLCHLFAFSPFYWCLSVFLFTIERIVCHICYKNILTTLLFLENVSSSTHAGQPECPLTSALAKQSLLRGCPRRHLWVVGIWCEGFGKRYKLSRQGSSSPTGPLIHDFKLFEEKQN